MKEKPEDKIITISDNCGDTSFPETIQKISELLRDVHVLQHYLHEASGYEQWRERRIHANKQLYIINKGFRRIYRHINFVKEKK